MRRQFAADLPKICAYAGELNQVWTNLIDNAVDAMDGAGELTIRTRQQDQHVIVEVVDTGKGIPDIFETASSSRFLRRKGKGKAPGSGWILRIESSSTGMAGGLVFIEARRDRL